ncbi:phiSA1p31-related protein [Streptomyces sp. CB03911]|uniref:phiSA1p31-related protein n=1 Tax=Streptomyces sp. CB03911 TaxID=1804758 RepID=UPI00093FF45E|nr:phiSA1p31-related protein [Streptomyces sp. CB03911]OKI19282.1 hypothetical protein A6A07_07210 [Streptomyces sp. CB03911]
MVETFKVGDKVESVTFGKGTVALGPFQGVFSLSATRYAVELTEGESAGRIAMMDEHTLKAVPTTFEIGARVVHQHTGDAVSTVAAGPFREHHSSRVWYVLENLDGSHQASDPKYLSAAPEPAPDVVSVGDRVRILEARFAESVIGKLGTVTRVDCTFRQLAGDLHPFEVKVDGGGTPYVKRVERITDEPARTFVYDGVTYDLDATYEDEDGDLWRWHTDPVHEDGSPRAGMNGNAPRHNSLRTVVANYGPLTKITE